MLFFPEFWGPGILFIECVCEQRLERVPWKFSSHEPFLYLLPFTSASTLNAAAFLGGEDLIPFYNLLDGGREGKFFRVIISLWMLSDHIWLVLNLYRPDISLCFVQLAFNSNLIDMAVSKL